MGPLGLPNHIEEKVYPCPMSGCWLWGASGNRSGYGQVRADGRLQVAHRVVYGLLVGKIPEGLTLDHICRNRACVNPDHLEPVSGKENILRGKGPCALNAAKTHCKRGHPLSGGNVRPIAGRVGRQCIACEKFHDRLKTERRHARKAVA